MKSFSYESAGITKTDTTAWALHKDKFRKFLATCRSVKTMQTSGLSIGNELMLA